MNSPTEPLGFPADITNEVARRVESTVTQIVAEVQSEPFEQATH